MGLISLNSKPSKQQLRGFGDIALFMCNTLGLLLMWMADLPIRAFIILCITGMVIYLLSRISLVLVKPIYIGLNAATFPVGWLVSHIVMALFYYVIIGCVGLTFKLIKRDPLNLAYDPEADSYWIPYKHIRTIKDYFHQF